MKKFLLSTTIFFIFIATATAIYASTTDGTIDPSTLGNYKAVLQNDPGIGSSNLTINFGLFTDPAVAPYNIHITSNGITGYAWSPIMGWISMNCANPTSTCTSNNDNFKVSVSSTGVLSGYAWAQNTGWVNFGPFANAGTSQVKIGTDGKFGGTLGSAGYAWGQNVGWIVFDCSNPNTCVETDYRYATQTSGGGGGGGGGGVIIPPVIPPVIIPPVIIPPVIIPPVVPPVVIPPVIIPPVVPPVIIPPVTPPNPPITLPNQPPSGPGSGTGGGGIPTIILEVVKNWGIQGPGGSIAKITRIAVDKTVENTEKVFTSPEGKKAATAVTATGAALTTGMSLAATFALNPLSAAEAFLIPFRLWSLLLGVLGIRKRVRKWGVVYDSQTKQPIDPAYVTMFDAQGVEVNSAITDIDGRYGFLLAPGTYTMSAQKTNYTFPSQILANRSQDELYDDLYFGAPFTVENESFVVIKNIPLDPVGFDWNEYIKKSRGLTHFFARHEVLISKITWGFFGFGFITAALSLFYNHNFYNYAICAFYLVLGFMRATGVVGAKTSTIVDKAGNLVPFALVQVYNEANARIARKVASVHGRIFCLIPNGTYYMTVSTKNPGQDGGYTLVHTTEKFTVTRGYIHKKVIIG